MDLRTLTAFFKWCTLLTGGLLVFSVVLFAVNVDGWYALHNSILPITRESYDLVLYMMFGVYEFFFWCFCVIPYIALWIIGKNRT
ncbi:MAG: hypothetical protein NUV50_06870 [Rhodospirillales bacterium]|nr:hypothetical protein [Rhodospirillales bacterium]